MSRLQSTRRRLALLAGSSLVAAAASLGAAVLTPTAVLAQTCTPAAPPAANPDPDRYTCSGTPHAAGITYTSAGSPLTVVTTTAGMDIGTVGINLTGTGDDDITFESDVEIDAAGVTGALLEMRSESGAITVDGPASGLFLDADDTDPAAVTHGLLAVSDTGDIVVDTLGEIDAESGANLPSGVAGIEARTGGDGTIDLTVGTVRGRERAIHAVTETGDITISAASVSTTGFANGVAVGIHGIEAVGGGDISVATTGSASGRLRGIYTDSTSGTGATTIETGGSVSGGIEAHTGTGSLLIDIVGGNVNGGVATVTGGAATINIAAGRTVGAMTLTPAAGTTTTVNSLGTIGTSSNSSYDSVVAIASGVSGGRIVVNSDGLLGGVLDLSGNTGGAEVNIGDSARWRTAGPSTFGSGNDSVSISAGGLMGLGSGQQFSSQPNEPLVLIDFGAGTNTLLNEGVLLAGVAGPASNSTEGDPRGHAANEELRNLTNFDNAGTILMGGTMRTGSSTALYAHILGEHMIGSFSGTDELLIEASDQWPDDILVMPGATFTGLDGSRIVFDIDLMGSGQDTCDASLRNADGDLVADCLGIEGGTTAGTTLVTLHDVFAGDRGIYNPEGTVLIDVSGGTSAARHFVLDPLSDSYSAAFGGVIDKGALFYPLVYDEATQQHKVVGLVSGNAAQFPLLASAAHSLWRVTTGSWFDRQADLRGGLQDVGGGVWLRINGEFAERDEAYSTGAAGATFDFDNSFSQNSYAVTGGADVIAGGAGDTAYVVGLMAGYGHSTLDFEASTNEAQFDGFTGGLYASLVSGGLFVDAALSANKLDLKNDIPALNLYPAGTVLDTHLLSVGGQLEAGWRMAFGGGAFVEPLANLSYVRTTYDELEIPAGDPASPRIGVEYDDPTSLRAGLGARLGLDQDLGSVRAQYSGLVRLWNEFEGETQVTLRNLGADPVLIDDFSGQFTEIGVGAAVFGMDGIVSGFVNLGGKLGDDYQATTASAGVRVNW